MQGEQHIVVGEELASMLNVSSIPHFLIYNNAGRLVQYKADRSSAGEPLRKMLEGMKYLLVENIKTGLHFRIVQPCFYVL